MAVQKIIIAKLADRSGKEVATLLRKWTRRPPPLKAVNQFVARLRRRSIDLPVNYFSEHLDMWTCCPIDLWFERVPDFRTLDVQPRGIRISWYQLPDRGVFKRTLLKIRRRLKPNQHDFHENRMLCDRMIEVVESWEKLVDDAAIVIIRQPFYCSPTDDDVLAALKKPLRWLRSCRAFRRPSGTRE